MGRDWRFARAVRTAVFPVSDFPPATSGVADPYLSILCSHAGWISRRTRNPVLFRHPEACSLTPPGC